MWFYSLLPCVAISVNITYFGSHFWRNNLQHQEPTSLHYLIYLTISYVFSSRIHEILSKSLNPTSNLTNILEIMKVTGNMSLNQIVLGDPSPNGKHLKFSPEERTKKGV